MYVQVCMYVCMYVVIYVCMYYDLLYNVYQVFPGGKVGRGVALTTHPLVVPRSKRIEEYISTPLRAFVAYEYNRVKPTYMYYVFIHVCIYECIMYLYMYVLLCIYMCVCMYYVFMYVRVCVCIHVCIYVCICM
jgi:hypothetical protein